MGHIKPVSAEEEQKAVDAILALGWTEDSKAAQHAVIAALSVEADAAELILKQLSDRRIVHLRARANNIAETGSVERMPYKWERAGVPTTLELIRELMAMEGFVTLDSSRELVGKFCGCTADEANHLLYDLRDRDILLLQGEGVTWLWRRPSTLG